jgi:hypothetical protein
MSNAAPCFTGDPVVWDCETSGLDRDTHDILSISARCGDALFHSYARPTKPIPADATRVNGIRDEDVSAAPPYAEVAVQFARWLRDVAGPRPLLVAYNGDAFDLPFMLKKNSAVDPAAFPAFDAIYSADALRAAKKVFSRAQVGGSFRQAALYGYLFGAAPEGQHTSQGDVEALTRIVRHNALKEVVTASARPVKDITGRCLLPAV